MRVLLKWLADHVEIRETAAELADMLTMSGLEVEGVIDLAAQFANVRVGRVTAVKPHPSADKLSVCEVNTGDAVVTVVCGAPNVAKDRNVVIALPGAVIPGGTIETGVIRGVASAGMLCSEKELGLALHSDGIILLGDNVKPGDSIFAAYPDLDDRVLEVNITPNRGDCLSHLGIAREIAALTGRPLRKESAVNAATQTTAPYATIRIDAPALCPRYTAKLIDNVTIQPSPDFMKVRLFACGMRPINNVVDITNFVMLDAGQPLHAFDYDLLADHAIIVRNAEGDETFTTLDGKERRLTGGDLVIADAKGAIALAGVMGGLNSEVTDSTRRILLESAFFTPATIRKTAKRLGIQSEASYRFERGIDMDGVAAANEKAAQLMARFAKGTVTAGVLDCTPLPRSPRVISFRPDRCNAYIGDTDITAAMQPRLENVGFTVDRSNTGNWLVSVPSHRHDVTIEEDLYEEVVRLGYYREVQTTLPTIPMRARTDGAQRAFRTDLRAALINLGATELITYSFLRAGELERSLPASFFGDKLVYISNPLAEEPTVMRPTLVPSLLAVAELNHSRANFNFTLFEVGKRYLRAGSGTLPFAEDELLGLVFSGARREKSWYTQELPADFYAAKGFLELVIGRIGGKTIGLQPIDETQLPFLHPVESALVTIDGAPAGWLGSLHPEVASRYDLKRDIVLAELSVAALSSTRASLVRRYTPVSRFPRVDRDITIVVDEQVRNDDILAVIGAAASDILKTVRLTDVFRSEKIGAAKKSMTYKLYYQSPERTLSDDEVNADSERVAARLHERFAK